MGFIEFMSQMWSPLSVQTIPGTDWIDFKQVQGQREILDFNLGRVCELELTKNKWLSLQSIEIMDHACKEMLAELRTALNSFFKIEKILYDEVGFHMFKIFLLSMNTGKLIKPNFRIFRYFTFNRNESNYKKSNTKYIK
jgi:hypothetical protein